MSIEQPTKKQTCLYCGNNPTNHFSAFVSQTISLHMIPLARSFEFLGHPVLFSMMHSMLLRPWMWLLHLSRAISWNTDSSRASSGRSLVIWQEAERRGIRMEQMVIEKRPVEQYRALLKNRWYYFGSLPIPLSADRRAYAWLDSKAYFKDHMERHAIPVPKGGRATSLWNAERIFERIEKPVIVKPESGSRGRHSLTNLKTQDELRHAFRIAQQLCHSVVVEEHLVGSVYRGTYVGGEVVGILRGDPPRVTGDGVSTIGELILEKNRTKPERVKDIVVSPVIHEFLARMGYTLDSVLPLGVTIDVIEKIGLSYGGNSAEEFHLAHPKLLSELKRAGDSLGVPIVGFDFISEDITKDPEITRWGIIEANTMPFIDLHHFPHEGEPVNVAKKVWDLWKQDGLVE